MSGAERAVVLGLIKRGELLPGSQLGHAGPLQNVRGVCPIQGIRGERGLHHHTPLARDENHVPLGIVGLGRKGALLRRGDSHLDDPGWGRGDRPGHGGIVWREDRDPAGRSQLFHAHHRGALKNPVLAGELVIVAKLYARVDRRISGHFIRGHLRWRDIPRAGTRTRSAYDMVPVTCTGRSVLAGLHRMERQGQGAERHKTNDGDGFHWILGG